jgi:PAS domain S-box-containing protein
MKSRDLLDQETTSVEFISEKSSQDSLRQKAEFDEAVMSNMSEGLYTVDENGLVSYMNPTAEKLFGWTLEEIRGKKMHDITHYKHRDGSPFPASVCAGLKVLTEGKELRDFEDVFIKKDGSFFDVMYSSSPLKKNGIISGLIVVFRDITEIKKSQLALKESEEKSRLFVEYAPAAMAMFDKEMRYVSVSKRWMKEYDLAGDIIGKRHYELFPNILERWKAVHSRCMGGAIERSDDDYYEKDDGTPVWLKWEVYPWYNATSEIGGIVIFTENITERKKAEQAIKESEERFRTMANEAPLFVWLTDEKLQTTYLNKAGLDYFGLDESIKMTELSWKKFIHPDDIERVLAIMNEAARLRESYTIEMRLKNGSTGEYRWFLDKGAPRYNDEKFTGFIGTTLDIHDRRETEKELENKVKQRTRELNQQNVLLNQQNILVKKILDSSVDLIAVYDTDTRIISINQPSLNVFGGKEEEVIGKKLLEVLPQIKDNKAHTDLLRAIEGEVIHNEIYQSVVTGRYYENSLIPLKDEQDKIYAVLAIAHDNSELITSSKKLNEAQQIAQIGHWDWNVSTNHLTWSDNMYNIYGINTDEGIDFDKFISLVHPDDRANMQANIQSAFQSQTFDDFFHRITTPAGEVKIIHARGEVMLDKNGKITRMVGTGQDVTKQKLLEQQLIDTSRKFEERNRFVEKLINSSLDLIMVVDKDLRFITLNKKAETVVRKVYNGQIIGEKITDINPSLKDTQPYEDLLNAFKGNIIIRDRVKATIAGDQYYELNYIPLYEEYGEVYAVMVISHDITENIRQMEELKKLSESDVQKNNFIAMASHELKTPITSIKGYVQLLLNAFDKEKVEEKPLPPLLVRSSLISVDKQITRLTRLISELLDLTKIETGTLELKKEKFSLNELAIETVEDILYTNTKHQINLFHDFQAYVFADKDRMGQVMINFLTNAIKYSPNSNKIDVWIHQTKNEQVAFSVKDYGIGIDKEEQEKIFERFYRAKGKEEQTYPGFGIGLFIANEFVEKHGGQVLVESEKGKGSVFTFTLPIVNQ